MVEATAPKGANVNARNAMIPINIFVAGPARAILPSLSLSYSPAN